MHRFSSRFRFPSLPRHVCPENASNSRHSLASCTCGNISLEPQTSKRMPDLTDVPLVSSTGFVASQWPQIFPASLESADRTSERRALSGCADGEGSHSNDFGPRGQSRWRSRISKTRRLQKALPRPLACPAFRLQPRLSSRRLPHRLSRHEAVASLFNRNGATSHSR